MKNDTIYICITPIRDEAWILPLFLEINSQWADYIILLDQCSADESATIAKAHPKVVYIKNESMEYDELYRSKIMWEVVRKIVAKKKVVFALDADEYIPPAVLQTEEWKSVADLPIGTRIFMKWIQILPGFKNYYDTGKLKPFGYVDDGTNIAGGKIHNDRVPENKEVSSFRCQHIVNIHLSYMSVNRNYKKHTWYMMWEFLHKDASAFQVDMSYRKFIGWSADAVKPVEDQWIYDTAATGKLDIARDAVTWWDKDIIQWMKEYGTRKFKKLDIWDFDWNLIAKQTEPSFRIADPRSGLDKKIINYIRKAKYKKNTLTKTINFTISLFWK